MIKAITKEQITLAKLRWPSINTAEGIKEISSEVPDSVWERISNAALNGDGLIENAEQFEFWVYILLAEYERDRT